MQRHDAPFKWAIAEDTKDANAIFEKVALKPGDVLVVTVPEDYPYETYQKLQNSVAKIFPNNQIMVMPDSITLSVISQEDAPNTTFRTPDGEVNPVL